MPSERILVVEDNPELEQKLVDFMVRIGLDPTPIYAVDELLDAVRNVDPAAVIVDLDLSRERTAELCGALRRVTPPIYLILMGDGVGLAEARVRIDARDVPDCFLAKPFALPILKKILLSRPPRHVPEEAAGGRPEAELEVVDLVPLAATAAVPAEPLPEGGVAERIIDLSRQGSTGRLEVLSGGLLTAIYFQDGVPLQATGGSIETTLGRVLLRRKLITEAAYREVLATLASNEGNSDLIGEALMKAGHITASRLHDALSLQVEEKIVESMGYESPRARFVGEQPQFAVTFRKAAENLVMKGVMRHGDFDLLIQQFKPLKDRCPALKRGAALDAARLSSRLNPVLDRFDGSQTVEELAEAEPIPAPDFLKLLHGLTLIDAVDLLAERQVVPGTSEVSTAVVESAVREAVLRELLQVTGRSAREVLRIEGGRAELLDAEVEDAYRNRVRVIDAIVPEAASDPDLSDKIEGIRAALSRAREQLLDPAVRPEAPAPRPERGVSSRPELSAEYHLREGRACLERGDLERGIAELRRAHELAADEPEFGAALGEALRERGTKLADEGDLKEARRLAGTALEVTPRQIEALCTLAELNRLDGNAANAEKFFRYALKVDPHNATALRALRDMQERAVRAPRAATRLLVLASDLLFVGAAAQLPQDERRGLVSFHREVFRGAIRRHFGPLLKSAGFKDGVDYAYAEPGESILVAVCYDERLLGDRKAAVWRTLSFPDYLREEVGTKMDLHLINSGLPLELQRAAPRPRLAIAVGDGGLDGGPHGAAAGIALRSLALESDRFTIDRDSAQELAATSDLGHLLMFFAGYNYRLRSIPETERGESPVYVAHYEQEAVPAAATKQEAERPQPRKPRARVRPSRTIQRRVSPDELGVLNDLGEDVKARFEGDLTTKFNRMKEEEERRRKKSIWQKVIIGEDDSKVDVERYQVKTHLFAPLLGDARVYMGMQDFRRWFAYMEEIGRSYVDALASERDSFLQSGRQAYAGLAIDRTFEDFEQLTDAKLLAVSEALQLFPLCIDPDESYEEVTLAEFARIAARRYAALAGAMPANAAVLPLVLEVYRKAIDTPDDSVEPVNLFQWTTLLALIGVTVELQESEIRDLRDAYGETSRKFGKELERVRRTYGQHVAILKAGLDRYQRIRQILALKSPLSLMGDERSLFEKGYHLPLFRFVK